VGSARSSPAASPLKPGNLFLVGGVVESVKILDFGIAHLPAASRMTETGTLLGTPRYMAPEQARGEAGLDARADVFSLGCVLYECVTGEAAFDGPHPMAVLARILFEEPPAVRARRPEVPDALEALIARMLAKRAVDRPRDGHEVAQALRALADEPPTAASALPWAHEAAALTGKEQRAVAVILAAHRRRWQERPCRSTTTERWTWTSTAACIARSPTRTACRSGSRGGTRSS